MASKRWNICNVLATGAEARRLWQFDAKGQNFKLGRELTVRGGDPLPEVVKKSWSTLWQPKLNVACLPPERVFLRAAQFPAASFQETLAMVDLQMEKLSPMPVGQIVWTMHCIPHPAGSEQTVIVTIAERAGRPLTPPCLSPRRCRGRQLGLDPMGGDTQENLSASVGTPFRSHRHATSPLRPSIPRQLEWRDARQSVSLPTKRPRPSSSPLCAAKT